MFDQMRQELLESTATIGNLTLQLAGEHKYIKKYIINRLKSAGIKVKTKSTYGGKTYDKSKLQDNIFSGFTIATYDEELTSSGEDMSLSNITIEFYTQGNKIYVKYVLYNEKVVKQIAINNITVKAFMDEVVASYTQARKELAKTHQIKHTNKGGSKYESEANEKRYKDVAAGFNYQGSSIRYLGSAVGYYNQKKSFNLDVKYPQTREINEKHKLAVVIKKLLLDPTIKRYMDKDDKLDKDFTWGWNWQVPNYTKHYDYLKEVIVAFVDYLDAIPDVHVTYVKYGKLELEIAIGEGEGMKSYLIKKELIERVNDEVKSMDKGLDRMIKRAPKYGHLLMKRFWAKPEKYIS